MLTITDSARALLARMLDDGEVPRTATLRLLSDAEGALALALGAPQLGDEVFSYRGRVVLAIDSGARRRLRERTLDTLDTPQGPQLLPR